MSEKKTAVRKPHRLEIHWAEKETGLRKRQGPEREIGKGEKQKELRGWGEKETRRKEKPARKRQG